MEKETSINKIVGASDNPELEKKAWEYLNDSFNNPNILDIEKPKTQEQNEISNSVFSELQKYLSSNFNLPDLKLESKHVHIIDVSKMSEKSKKLYMEGEKKNTAASNVNKRQRIDVFDRNKGFNNLYLAEYLAHEAVHSYSFNSVTVAEESKKIVNNDGTESIENIKNMVSRRSGLSMTKHGKKGKLSIESINRIIDEGGVYFEALNEAITQELAIRFMRSNWNKIPHLDNSIDEVKRVLKEGYESFKIKNPDTKVKAVDELTGIEYGDENAEVTYVKGGWAYEKNRQIMWGVMQEIAIKNPDEFNDQEEVFKMFVKHYFDGRLLEIARLLEKTYGRIDGQRAVRKGAEYKV